MHFAAAGLVWSAGAFLASFTALAQLPETLAALARGDATKRRPLTRTDLLGDRAEKAFELYAHALAHAASLIS